MYLMAVFRPTQTRFGLTTIVSYALVASFWGPAAFAADKTDDLIKNALELRRNGDDQGAYPLFKQAYDASRSPRAAAQWGFCEQALGRWADAETHLSEALKASADPWVVKNRPVIVQSLAVVKSHIARVEIVGEPVGAEVLVNGNVVGRLPLPEPVRVTAGEIEVELRTPGHARASKSLRVEGRQFQKVVLRAEREAPPVGAVAAAPALPSSGTTGAPAPMGTGGTTTTVNTPPPSAPVAGTDTGTTAPVLGATAAGADAGTSSTPSWRRAAKWVSWGLGAAALGVGVYGIVDNRGGVSDFDRGCAIDSQSGAYATPGSGQTDASCMDLKQGYESAATIGLVGVIAGTALSAAGVAFLLTEPSATDARATTATTVTGWSCAPGAVPRGGISLGCLTHF